MRRITIPETELVEFARCPMRVTDVPYPVSDLERDVQRVMANMLLASFLGRPVTLRDIRVGLDKLNRKHPAELKNSEMTLVRISARLHDLFGRYKVLQPITPYRLNVEQLIISGEYAVLRRTNRKSEVSVLRLRGYKNQARAALLVKQQNPAPDLMNYARWLHLLQTEPDFHTHSVLNFHLFTARQWMDTPNLTAVKKALKAVSDVHLNGLRYPAPGGHCFNCQTRQCEA